MPTRKTITDGAAAKFRAPKEGQIDYFDKQFSGLSLRVSQSGVKAWTYLYRINGKARRMTLGRFPETSVADAHDKWRKARDDVRAKKDPGAIKQQIEKDPGAGRTDFRGVAAEWLKRDQEKNRSHRLVARMIEREVLPAWGHREITDIKRRDVLDLIDSIADRGHVTSARRVHGRLHRLFRWAVGRGIVELNPLTGLDKPGTEVRRDRVLTDAELVKVWNAATRIGFPYGPAFQLLALTGARREEIAQLRWSEIDGDVINLKGARTKNGEAHIIPLSAPARAILENLPRFQGSNFVITMTGKVPVSMWSKAKREIDDLAWIDDWRTHDLRRTTATGLQKLKVPLQVTESVLGHVAGSRAGVVGIYQRHDYAEEKAAALEAWGAHVMALVKGRKRGKVVAFGSKG
jgi:integrase